LLKKLNISKNQFDKQTFQYDKNIFFIDLCLLFIVSFIFLIFKLGSFPLFASGEGRYAEIAREMLANGNWLSPGILGVPFLDKPDLYYWIAALSMKVFGVNLWAVRLPQMLFGIFGCLVAYIIGSSCFSRLVGLLSAILLLLSPLYFCASHYSNMDLEFAILLSASLGSFMLGIRYRDNKLYLNLFMFSVYVFASFAFLTKGVLGLVFPFIIISAWISLFKRWQLIKYMKITKGFCVFLIIVLPWVLISQYINHNFLYSFLYDQQVNDFFRGTNSIMPVWFYPAVLLIGLLPWSLISISAWPKIYSIWNYIENCSDRKHIKESECFNDKGIISFLVVWFVALLMFFSFFHVKHMGYILPVTVPLSVLLGVYITRSIGTAGFYLSSIFSCIVCVFIGFIFLNVQHYINYLDINLRDLNNFLSIVHFLGVFIILCGVINLFVLFLRRRISSCFVWLFMMAVFNLSLLYLAPSFNTKTILPILNSVKDKIGPEDIVVDLEHYHADLPIYLNRNIYLVKDWNNKDIDNQDSLDFDFFKNMMKLSEEPDFVLSGAEFQSVWDKSIAFKTKLIIFANKNTYYKWEKILPGNINLLAEDNNTVVFSN
tara:strand:+ start:2416 stop:4215 length:1800 start_codon:yes stop_codon:yes gene_type:complete